MRGWKIRDWAATWRCWATLSAMSLRASIFSSGVVVEEVVSGGMAGSGSVGWSAGGEDDGGGGVREDSVVDDMAQGDLLGRRQSDVLVRESEDKEGESGRCVREEEGDGENGSKEVARCRFVRRELRNAV